MKPILNLEHYIDFSPHWAKHIYIKILQALKKISTRCGIIAWLDKHAAYSRQHHYIRSLFATHQLNDMIALDTPWWTYHAIEFVDEHLANMGHQAMVFEYGSGASTLWLAKRCQSLISIEHDAQWYQQIAQHTNNNKNILLLHLPPNILQVNKPSFYSSDKQPFLDFQSYVESINKFERQFDIIIIDGRCRPQCLSFAIEKLNKNGIIVFDNSNRERYQYCLSKPGIEIQRFWGRVPGSPFRSETAILKKINSY